MKTQTTSFRLLLRSCAAILLVAAGAKLWSSLGKQQLLWAIDPVLGIEYRQLLRVAAGIEVVVAWLCWSRYQLRSSHIVLSWLCCSFVFYRVGLAWTDWKSPCGCFGGITDAIGITPENADYISWAILAYLVAVAGFTLLRPEALADRPHATRG